MKDILFIFVLPFFLNSANASSVCIECHGDTELQGTNRSGTLTSMYVDTNLFTQSVHGDLECADCHTSLMNVEDFPHEEELPQVDCGTCHEEVSKTYNQTKHGLVYVQLDSLAPPCWGCHGKHDILSSNDPQSKTYFQNLANTCCGCHEKRNQIAISSIKQPCIREDYLNGIHGRLVTEGNKLAPTCNTCHPAHEIRKRIDPESKTNVMNIPQLCGECHIDELKLYSSSIHYRALMHGMLESATCIDCHNEHNIVSNDLTISYPAHKACVRCHNDEMLIKKYDLNKEVVNTYEDSYHGLSIKLGRQDAATCASCHGAHDILSQTEPASSINKNNLKKTCQKCHPNATKSFAQSYTHESMLIRSNPVNYYISIIYIILIVTVIGGMFLHNFSIYLKYLSLKKAEEKNLYIIRFKPAEIFQHALLMISFTVLAISGFALRFPEANWVKFLVYIGFTESSRGIIHRIAAVIFISISLYHIYYISFTRRGKYLFKQILFRTSDIKEMLHSIKYYIGIQKIKPEYDEFDYTEKAEYWSLIWGGVVMEITGIILWFPTIIPETFPSWIIRAAELIHFYEAILATLAILIFHLFFVIAHPEQFPMNLSWLTGKMSLKTALKKHPKWIKRILRENKNTDLLPEYVRKNCKTIEDLEKMIKTNTIREENE